MLTLLRLHPQHLLGMPEFVSCTCPLLTVKPLLLAVPVPVNSLAKVGMVMLPDVAALVGISKLTKFPGWLMRNRFSPGTEAMVMFPPGAVSCPVLTTVPPSRFKSLPVPTPKLPKLMMLPG